MGRRGDNTGVNQTCPYIDEVRDFIEGVEWSDEEKDLEKQSKEACAMLEVIRQMNSDLRDFGNKQYDELYEMEKDRDYYEKRVRELENNIEHLQSDIKELQKELSQA